MDEGKILLINLSNMDTNVKQVLGSFILSLLHLNALSRSNLPFEQRKQFQIHCDEAHQFLTDTFENLTGLVQLPGIAVQRLMADGYGFGAEGDWKTAALVRSMKVMGAGREATFSRSRSAQKLA